MKKRTDGRTDGQPEFRGEIAVTIVLCTAVLCTLVLCTVSGDYKMSEVGPNGLCDPVVARNWVRIQAGSDVCHRGCAYRPTVLLTSKAWDVQFFLWYCAP